jgi:hypothetical protein
MLAIRLLAQKGWSAHRIHRYTGYPLDTVLAILSGHNALSQPRMVVEPLPAMPTTSRAPHERMTRISYDQIDQSVAHNTRDYWAARGHEVVKP